MNNDLNQIRIFCYVAELQSFTQAAQVLGIEKSTVSNKVNQLESRLGVKLLQRTTRSVKLTEAGSQYLLHCQRALEELTQGENRLSDYQQQVAGHLRMAVPQNFADKILPNIVTPFLQRYPKVTLDVIQGQPQTDLIKQGIDLEIRASFSDLQDSSLIHRQIYRSQRIFVASKAHIETHGLATTLGHLNQQPYIASFPQHSHDESFNRVLEGGKWHRFQARLKVNSMAAVESAVDAGLGFAILPVGMAEKKLTSGEWLQIAPEVALTDSVISLVYPSRKGQSSALRALINAMVQWGEQMKSR